MAHSPGAAARFDTAVKLGFARAGLAVARRPYRTILASLALTLFLALYVNRVPWSKKPRDIWAAQDTDVLRHDKYVQRHYDNAFRTEAAVLASNDIHDYATLRGLNKLVDLVEFVEGVPPYHALCTMATSTQSPDISYCAMVSILDLFIATNITDLLPRETYSQAARRALRPLNNDAEIKQAIFDAETFTSWSGNTLQRDDLVGGITGTGPNLTARALHHRFVLNGSTQTGDQQTPAQHWEIELRKQFDKHPKQFHDVQLVTFYEKTSSLEKSLDGQLVWISLGIVALTLYLVSTMGTPLQRSRVFIAIITLLNVVLALVSTFGVSAFTRLLLTPAHIILPVILLGVGADDAFLIVKTFDALMREDKHFHKRSIDDRIAITMAQAGSSILVTSATNSAVFFLGAISPVPALRSFNIWAGIGVLFDFLYSLTFFLAWFKIDTARYEARVLDCATRSASSTEIMDSNQSTEIMDSNQSTSHNWALHHIMSNSYSNLLVKRPIQLCVILLYVVVLVASAWGAVTLEVVFSPNSFDKVGSVQANYHASFSQYFDTKFHAGLFSKDLNFSDTKVQQDYLATCNATSGTLASNPYVEENSVDCWLDTLLSFGFRLHGGDFFNGLKVFLRSAAGQRYKADLVCVSKFGYKVDCLDSAAVRINSSRTNMFVMSNGDTADAVNMLYSLAEVAETSDAPGLFVSQPLFPIVELSGSVRRNSLVLMLVSFVAIGAVNFLLIGHPVGALLVLGSVCGTSLLLIGMLQFWNIFLNPVSMIVLGMSVGLSIDGSTHTVRSFLEHSGSRAERVRLALGDVGPAVLHGSVSTLVAISFLAFSDAFVVLVIFKSMFLILSGSLVHSLVILPVFLILIGPSSSSEADSERRETQILLFEDKLDLRRISVESLPATEAPSTPSESES